MKQIISKQIQKIGWRYERVNQLAVALKTEANRLRFREVGTEDIWKNIQMLSVLVTNEFIEIKKEQKIMMEMIEKTAFLLSREERQQVTKEAWDMVIKSEKLLEEFQQFSELVKEEET